MKRGPITTAKQRLNAEALRAYFEGVWKEEQEAQAHEWDTCRCKDPRPGPSYFKVRRCVRCARIVRAAA